MGENPSFVVGLAFPTMPANDRGNLTEFKNET
jgi:hypothetical protein